MISFFFCICSCSYSFFFTSSIIALTFRNSVTHEYIDLKILSCIKVFKYILCMDVCIYVDYIDIFSWWQFVTKKKGRKKYFSLTWTGYEFFIGQTICIWMEEININLILYCSFFIFGCTINGCSRSVKMLFLLALELILQNEVIFRKFIYSLNKLCYKLLFYIQVGVFKTFMEHKMCREHWNQYLRGTKMSKNSRMILIYHHIDGMCGQSKQNIQFNSRQFIHLQPN